MAFRLNGRWAMRYDRCQECGLTERPHISRGLCDRCYERARYWAGERVRQRAPRGDRRETKRRWRRENAERINAERRRSSIVVIDPLLGEARLARVYREWGETVVDLLLPSGRRVCGIAAQGLTWKSGPANALSLKGLDGWPV